MRVLQAARGAPLTGGAAGPGPDEPGVSRPAAPRRVALLVGIAVAVLAADIVSKALVVANWSDRSCVAGRNSPSAPVWLLGGFLKLCESRNPGAAFSIGGPSETILFTAIAVGVITFIVRSARRIHSLAWAVALGLLLGGAMGNLTDRIFRSPAPFRGWVVDWIELPRWPVFNLADSAIVCGGVLMVLLAMRGHRLDGTIQPAAPPPSAPDAADASARQPAATPPAGPARPAGPRPDRQPGGDGR
ncbi:MAG TPA: signal peptidase II [Streptosporangiaceae bacterium]|nr:signal peptidase II [Streptosporangiaceae bacterium]